MKKIFILSLLLSISPTFAYYTENIQNACGITSDEKYAVFTKSTYTCQSGYFLPANALACVQCPNGYTCPGGIFIFNEKNVQGLEPNINNINKSCASNIAHDKFAVFTPNIINLNWYSVGDTVYETNTCTYDQPITLPATNPTRPGYTFVGWRLRTNN